MASIESDLMGDRQATDEEVSLKGPSEEELDHFAHALGIIENLHRDLGPAAISAASARRSPNASVLVDARNLIQLARDAILGINKIGYPDPVRDAPEFRSYVLAVATIGEPIRVLTTALGMGTTSFQAMGETAVALIDDAAKNVEGCLEGIFNALRPLVELYPSEVGGAEASIISELAIERLNARKLVDETRAARDAAVSASDSARVAAGATGSSTLAEHFGAHARQEGLTANVLRVIAGGLLLAISAFAAYILIVVDFSVESLTSEIAKLATSIPVAVLAGYLGKEASRHRASANWSRQLEIQLKTLDAFIAPLPVDEQRRQRAELGKRVFGVQEISANSENAPALIPETVSLLESLAGIIRGPQAK